MGDKIRVGLIYGGKSGEHEVSLQTALAVMGAFDFDKYEIQPFYITKRGEWLSGGVLLEAPSNVEQLKLGGEGGEALAAVFGGLAPAAAGEASLQAAAAAAGSAHDWDDRRDVPAAAWHVRRGRHDSGPSGAGEHPLCRSGRTGFGCRDGQDFR